jgi:hypothetical protein
MVYAPNDPVKKLFFLHGITGALVNGDSAPAGTVYQNGTADGAVTVTVTNLATGKYKAEFTIPSGYAPGDIVECTVDSTISSIAICDSIWCEKLVQWSPTSLPAAAAGAVGGVPVLNANSRVPALVEECDADVIDAAALAADAITEIQDGLATSTDTTNIINAIDNLDNNTYVSSNIPAILERPDISSDVVVIRLLFCDAAGSPANLDSGNPTVSITGALTGDVSSRLDTGSWANPSTGEYTASYTNTSTDAPEHITWRITGTVGGIGRVQIVPMQVVDTTAVDFTPDDRNMLDEIHEAITVDGVTLANGSITDSMFVVGSIDQTVIPTGFLDRMLWLYRRFYKRMTRNKTTGAITMYADDNTTPISATQEMTDDGTTEEQTAVS